jgi:purine-nucleoside phosphorylase
MKQTEKLNETIEFINGKINGLKPEIGLILGSGLGDFAKSIENQITIPYSTIPHFIQSTVSGHAGNLIVGNLGDKTVAVLQGRVHYYEGHSMMDVIYPARTLVKLGCQTFVITNAAGGIGPNLEPGDLALITDHINLMGSNPLRGPNEEELGPRFPDMSNIYDKTLREKVIKIAGQQSIVLKTGVYAAMPGPTYETPAEIGLAKSVGSNMVGMSTVPESIAAHHMGAKIIGISCISNLAAGMSPFPLSHNEVKETAALIATTFQTLISSIVKGI